MEMWCSELRSLLLRLGVSSHVFILFVCRQVLALFAGVSLAVGFIRVRKWWAVEGERRFMELQSDVGGLELPTTVQGGGGSSSRGGGGGGGGGGDGAGSANPLQNAGGEDGGGSMAADQSAQPAGAGGGATAAATFSTRQQKATRLPLSSASRSAVSLSLGTPLDGAGGGRRVAPTDKLRATSGEGAEF